MAGYADTRYKPRLTPPARSRLLVMRYVWFLALLAAAAAAADVDYTQQGPCWFSEHRFCIGGCADLRVTTTMAKSSGANGCPAGPHPIIVFFNGFQVPSSANKDYTDKLASYGYAVIEYDPTPLLIMPDELELPIMYQILERLQQLVTEDPQSPYNNMDFNWIAVAGYSRGGKLAAVHLARNSTLKTAYLVDPVDSTYFTPNGFINPNAPEELAKQQPLRLAGISAGGRTAICNPEYSGYEEFFQALGSGSWLQVLPNAAHLAFARVPPRYLPVCGWGSDLSADPCAQEAGVQVTGGRYFISEARQCGVPEVISITAATCVAWFEHIRTGQGPPDTFTPWMQSKIDQGLVTFSIK